MDPSPGTFEMAQLMARMKVVTCISKDYTIEEWKQFRDTNSPGIFSYVSIMCRNDQGEFERIIDTVSEIPEIRMISVSFDQASFNRYKNLIERLRRALPTKSILATTEYSKTTEKKDYQRTGQKKNTVIEVAIPGPNEVEKTEVNFQIGKTMNRFNANYY